MGLSLGPVLSNIIITELEELVIRDLVADDTVKFYGRYVDDTLLVVKPHVVARIHQLLNQFDPNLKFTVVTFENETPHFLDLELHPDGISIFRKDTNTGLYTIFVPWSFRVSWINSLRYACGSHFCSPNKLPAEIDTIKKFCSWNGFPQNISNTIIHRLFNKQETHVMRLDISSKMYLFRL